MSSQVIENTIAIHKLEQQIKFIQIILFITAVLLILVIFIRLINLLWKKMNKIAIQQPEGII